MVPRSAWKSKQTPVVAAAVGKPKKSKKSKKSVDTGVTHKIEATGFKNIWELI